MDGRTHRDAHRVEGRPAAPGIALGPLVRLAAPKRNSHRQRSAAEEHQALLDALIEERHVVGPLFQQRAQDVFQQRLGVISAGHGPVAVGDYTHLHTVEIRIRLGQQSRCRYRRRSQFPKIASGKVHSALP